MVTEYHGGRDLFKRAEGLQAKFVGGRLCLDFVNTVGGRDDRDAVIRDKIASYADLLAWSVLAGMVERRQAAALARLAAHEGRKAALVLRRVIGLREALYRIFKCAMEGRRPAAPDVDRLRQELSIARANQRFRQRGRDFAWTFAERQEQLDRVMWPIALCAAELLTSDEITALKQCGGAECGWIFLDTSRNHRRQWCDMRDCGNRAKVRRFRAKGG